jgi:divalent metal cation (Fe/Co/Zn/Cd) transporter
VGSVVTSLRPALAQARLAQVLTLSWMVVEGGIAVVAGVQARSVALTAFGIDSGIELFTAGLVLHHLLKHEEGAGAAELARTERRTSLLVGLSLYALVAYIVATSVWDLVTRTHPDPSTPGLFLALAALLIMPGLWRWRTALAGRLRCSALRGDAACSMVCVYLAATLLAGLALNQLLGWWWADPVAALAMIWWIQSEAREAVTAGRPEDA